jgi:phage terminase large subunit-like protein
MSAPIHLLPSERRFVDRVTQLLAKRQAYTYNNYFPDTGPLRRELYPRSLLFWMAGKLHRERMFLAANRTSKTVSAAYELTAHATGLYKPWWPGRQFEGPTNWWVAGDTHETTRDIPQLELFGPREGIRAKQYGGMVPAHLVVDRTLKTGVADCIDTVWIKHKEKQHGARCVSTVQFKAYNQGRLSFQGTSLSGGIWLDEEPPDASEAPTGGGTPSGNGDIYTECLLRTATTGGLIMVTLTPLRGLTPMIDHWLETSQMADASGRLVNAKVGIFGEAA